MKKLVQIGRNCFSEIKRENINFTDEANANELLNEYENFYIRSLARYDRITAKWRKLDYE